MKDVIALRKWMETLLAWLAGIITLLLVLCMLVLVGASDHVMARIVFISIFMSIMTWACLVHEVSTHARTLENAKLQVYDPDTEILVLV